MTSIPKRTVSSRAGMRTAGLPPAWYRDGPSRILHAWTVLPGGGRCVAGGRLRIPKAASAVLLLLSGPQIAGADGWNEGGGGEAGNDTNPERKRVHRPGILQAPGDVTLRGCCLLRRKPVHPGILHAPGDVTLRGCCLLRRKPVHPGIRHAPQRLPYWQLPCLVPAGTISDAC